MVASVAACQAGGQFTGDLQATHFQLAPRLPVARIIGKDANNNWRTYAMKGEWQRAKLGLVSHRDAVAFVEQYWKGEQSDRFAAAPTSLYHDRTGDPDTLNVALMGEGNLLSLLVEGYDGPSEAEIRQKVLAALRVTLLMVDPSGHMPASGLDRDETTIRSTYGDLLPVRLQVITGASHTFVYPHDASQPNAQAVLNSFRLTSAGFQSMLGRVQGNVYVGRTFAGGRAASVDLDGDSRADLTFDRVCGFVVRMRDGAVTAIETDRPVTARLRQRTYKLGAYRPRRIAR